MTTFEQIIFGFFGLCFIIISTAMILIIFYWLYCYIKDIIEDIKEEYKNYKQREEAVNNIINSKKTTIAYLDEKAKDGKLQQFLKENLKED